MDQIRSEMFSLHRKYYEQYRIISYHKTISNQTA